MERCNEPVEQSRILWEQLADDWDERMGDTDNQYHREIIRPATLKLLNPHSGEYILDIVLQSLIQSRGKIEKCAFAVYAAAWGVK